MRLSLLVPSLSPRATGEGDLRIDVPKRLVNPPLDFNMHSIDFFEVLVESIAQKTVERAGERGTQITPIESSHLAHEAFVELADGRTLHDVFLQVYSAIVSERFPKEGGLDKINRNSKRYSLATKAPYLALAVIGAGILSPIIVGLSISPALGMAMATISPYLLGAFVPLSAVPIVVFINYFGNRAIPVLLTLERFSEKFENFDRDALTDSIRIAIMRLAGESHQS